MVQYITFFLNFIVDNFFFLKIKILLKVISISLFLQIYNFIIFGIFIDIIFFEVVHIRLTIVIMHYIFLISIQLKFLSCKIFILLRGLS